MANCGSNIYVEWVTGNETDANILVAFIRAFAEFVQKFARAWARAEANVDDECPKRCPNRTVIGPDVLAPSMKVRRVGRRFNVKIKCRVKSTLRCNRRAVGKAKKAKAKVSKIKKATVRKKKRAKKKVA